jgi:hypothetical protein
MRQYRLKNPRPVINNDQIVKFLYNEMHFQQVGIRDMSEKTGVNCDTLKDWRIRTNPRLKDIQACLNVLGYELVPQRIDTAS